MEDHSHGPSAKSIFFFVTAIVICIISAGITVVWRFVEAFQ